MSAIKSDQAVMSFLHRGDEGWCFALIAGCPRSTQCAATRPNKFTQSPHTPALIVLVTCDDCGSGRSHYHVVTWLLFLAQVHPH